MRPDDPNLLTLHAKVDAFFTGVLDRHGDQMACASGCSGCCQQTLSLFPVELARLKPAVLALDAETRELLRDRVGPAGQPPAESERPCPLLVDDRCAVYDDRPTICRSHGAPVRFRRTPDGPAERDVCPLNFTGEHAESGAGTAGRDAVAALDDADVLDLDRLNQLLAMTNELAVRQAGLDATRESLDDAIRRWLRDPA